VAAILVGAVTSAAMSLFVVLRRRAAVKSAVMVVREGREDASARARYREIAAGDEHAELMTGFKADGFELEPLGFRLLGDLVAERADGSPRAVARCWLDDKGTTFAYLVVNLRWRDMPTLTLESQTSTEALLTMRTTAAELAKPPFVHRQTVDPLVGHAELITRHRAFVRRHDARESLVQVASLDELRDAITRSNARTVAWRRAQEPDALLDADLRGLLGRGYARHGAAWAKVLRASLPRATVRKP